MKVIDAFSGQHFEVGYFPGKRITFPKGAEPRFPNVDGGFTTVHAVQHGVFSADAEVSGPDGRRQKVPLVVRMFHPQYPGQHVAFFPS